MNGFRKMRVAVSVATVWSSPESPRPVDEPALRNPADVCGWLGNMTVEDKLDLWEGSRVQTQILYGTPVIADEENGDWIKVLIPEQSTGKSPEGYPGWVPKVQLMEETDEESPTHRWAEVISKHALLTLPWPNPPMQLSFLTQLPVVLQDTAEAVAVHTPHGTGQLKPEDVRIVEGSDFSTWADGHSGRRIVEQAKRFLDLPYLWGGVSSFGYDCSGFAHSMHKSQGILIPRDASDQSRQGRLIEREQLEPGDLLFFAYEEGKGSVHHVGIYAGDGCMIHSPDSRSRIELIPLEGYKLAKEHSVSRRYWS